MASKFKDLQDEILRQQSGAQLPDDEAALLKKQFYQNQPMQKAPVNAPADVNMLKQQVSQNPDELALAMSQAPKVAGMFDNTKLGGQQGGFLAQEQSPEELKRELDTQRRMKAKESINKYFAPPEDESPTFKKLKQLFRSGTD